MILPSVWDCYTRLNRKSTKALWREVQAAEQETRNCTKALKAKQTESLEG